MNIAFLLYPTENVKVHEDTSFWIMHELKNRGHKVHYFLSETLFWQNGEPKAFCRESKTHLTKGFLPTPLSSRPIALSQMDCIFIRKEPPFDRYYLYALQILDTIKDKVFILNDPMGIATSGEKLYTLGFKSWIPDSCVTEDPVVAASFIKSIGSRVVVKPLHLKGGGGVFILSPDDRNLSSFLETATVDGSEKIMIQRFIDADRHGDKRILVLNGEILGSFIRKPSKGDFRANLGRGATLHRSVCLPKEKEMIRSMVPDLKKRGLWFVGLDIIGGYLTEINVTSPAVITDLKALYHTRPESKGADFIESRV